jgi:hypothetical protein
MLGFAGIEAAFVVGFKVRICWMPQRHLMLTLLFPFVLVRADL